MGKKTLSCHEHSARSSRSKPQLNGPGAYYNDKTSVSAAHSPRVGSPPTTWTLLLIDVGVCCTLAASRVTAHNMDTVAHWSRAPVELIDAEAKNSNATDDVLHIQKRHPQYKS